MLSKTRAPAAVLRAFTSLATANIRVFFSDFFELQCRDVERSKPAGPRLWFPVHNLNALLQDCFSGREATCLVGGVVDRESRFEHAFPL
jgi:hypothetical protein